MPFVYHYYIIQFHYLGWYRVSKNFWRWCAHQAHFFWHFLWISKKIKNLKNHMGEPACFWAILFFGFVTLNQFFWYVPLVYQYYIIKFHHLDWDRLTKNFWRWCAHQAHFLWRFLKFEKNFKSYGRTRMFLSDFSIFWICALIHFF